MDNNYVLKHDFGYGKNPEQEELNKLMLRDFNDLQVYVDEIINTMFVANVNNNVVEFLDDHSKSEVIIERI